MQPVCPTAPPHVSQDTFIYRLSLVLQAGQVRAALEAVAYKKHLSDFPLVLYGSLFLVLILFFPYFLIHFALQPTKAGNCCVGAGNTGEEGNVGIPHPSLALLFLLCRQTGNISGQLGSSPVALSLWTLPHVAEVTVVPSAFSSCTGRGISRETDMGMASTECSYFCCLLRNRVVQPGVLLAHEGKKNHCYPTIAC